MPEAEQGADHEATLTVLSDCSGAAKAIAVALTAPAPRPQVRLEGGLELGIVAVQSPTPRQLTLVNAGAKAASWRLECADKCGPGAPA